MVLSVVSVPLMRPSTKVGCEVEGPIGEWGLVGVHFGQGHRVSGFHVQPLTTKPGSSSACRTGRGRCCDASGRRI